MTNIQKINERAAEIKYGLMVNLEKQLNEKSPSCFLFDEVICYAFIITISASVFVSGIFIPSSFNPSR